MRSAEKQGSRKEPERGGVAFNATDFDGFLEPYLVFVPLPLALERAIECEILAAHRLERPVLDVGCGDGVFAKILFAGPIETGIDPDGKELEVATRMSSHRELIECPGDAVPKPDGSYRTILANSVLEHIPDLPPVLKEMNRLLDPEGSVFVTVPTHRFEHYTVGNLVLRALRLPRLASAFQRAFKRFWRLYNVLPPERWRELFAQAGFQVVETFEYEPPRLTLLKEAFMPFSVPGAIGKRVWNRWVLTPRWLRRVLIKPGVWMTRWFMRPGSRAEEACLVFMRLRKVRP